MTQKTLIDLFNKGRLSESQQVFIYLFILLFLHKLISILAFSLYLKRFFSLVCLSQSSHIVTHVLIVLVKFSFVLDWFSKLLLLWVCEAH